MKQRLTEWIACPGDITLGKIYTLTDGEFIDDADDQRDAVHGMWEDVEDCPVEKQTVEKRLIEWKACPSFTTLNKIYILEDGMFEDDIGHKRSIAHGVWEEEATTSMEVHKEPEDVVNSPTHYKFFDAEVIDVIKATLTPEEFRGYCVGNALKYRLRAGKKDDTLQDISKADKYEAIYEECK